MSIFQGRSRRNKKRVERGIKTVKKGGIAVKTATPLLFDNATKYNAR